MSTAPTDIQALMEQRNKAEEAIRTGKPAEPPKPNEPAPSEPVKPGAPGDPHRLRSLQRQVNQFREEAAELRGKLEALRELGAVPAPKAASVKGAEDPEPVRSQFASDAEYQRALGKWDARQEVKKAEEKRAAEQTDSAEVTALREELAQAAELAQTAIKDLFPDYEQKKELDDEEGIKVDPSKHLNLCLEIARSPYSAHIAYYFFDHQKELQEILDMAPDAAKQVRAIHRLEGRLEKEYSNPKAPEAKPQGENRVNPAEADAGRNATERDVRKPRPSTEVAARGGSPAPDDPKPGTAAWAAMRNARLTGR